MTITSTSRKINKLFRTPNLFFYDYFRKKAFINSPQKAKETIEEVNKKSNIIIDIVEIKKIGLSNYIKKNLKAGQAPEDGFDKNSLLVWSGYLNGLIHFIDNVKQSMSMDLTIYTLGGGYNIQVPSDKDLDVKIVSGKLSSRPDFIIELSNKIGELYILHFYLYDINTDGIAVIRSNRALIRKCLVDELENTFSIQETSYQENIDAVYTWVNHSDVEWKNYWLETFSDQEFDPDRYTSNDELKYSLRSLNKYAPWLRNIYIVSNCSKPVWLKDCDKIIWIDHKEIFPNENMLPTFNSHAIECCLHNIKGLSEKFIYLNDDFILSQPCLPADFFDETGRSISYFESYGMVNPETKQNNLPDYLIAAGNSNKLLKNKFKTYNARNLHRHVPYALKKSILIEIENSFPDVFEKTRYQKIRSENDINLTSFLYHHYSLANGSSVKSDLAGMIVRPENINQLLNKDAFKYKILCFNDGNGSSANEEYKKMTLSYFDKRFNEIASWEHNFFNQHIQE